MSTNTRELVYLAGLLHDERIWNQVSNSPIWEQLGLTLNQQKNNLALPDSALTFIERADQLACGFDRLANEHGDEAVPLASILSRVLIEKNQASAEKSRVFSVQPLSLKQETVMPQHFLEDGIPVEQSAKLWRDFASEFERLPTGSLSAFSGSLYHLLRRFLWCIPAAVQPDRTDISLFHHLKLTGALAQCLYDSRHSSGEVPLKLLCVDLSGIQAFIYNIGSTYAAKSLKGRSFSLQALLDGITRKLIRITRTSPSHLVYSSGGKFFMLLPNTKKITDRLQATQRETERAVWEAFSGNLYVCFGQVNFQYDLQTNTVRMENKSGYSLGDLWKTVSQNAAEQKQQKNRSLLLDEANFDDFFVANGLGGRADQCAVTGEEGEIGKTLIKEKETILAKTVRQQIHIGRELSKHRYQLVGTGGFKLMDKIQFFRLLKTLPAELPPDGELLKTLQSGENGDFLPEAAADSQTTFGFRFFGGSQMAQILVEKAHQAKTFEELTGIVRENRDDEKSAIIQSKRTGHYNRLAVLRMDVDGLGKLFTHGFSKERASFSAYATLSGLLDWFFSGYLNTIRDRAEFQKWVNIIYSGGDDVFAVGRWNSIIDFASAVQHDFKTFTGRDDLTISAGIELMRPRFPIGKAADAAGEAEDRAKDFNKDRKLFPSRHEKDAVCLFNVAIGWNEFAVVRLVKEQWDYWLTEEVLSKGILRSMFDWYEVSTRKDKQTSKPLNDQSWRWNAAYSLARQRTRDPNTARNQALDTLKLVLMCNQFKDDTGKIHPIRFDAFIVACRWAELTFRDKLNDH